jgi:hypothetical protein
LHRLADVLAVGINWRGFSNKGVKFMRNTMVEPSLYLFADMLWRVQSACVRELGNGIDLSRVVVEPSKDASHGDMATNAAMVLAGARSS